MRIALRESRRKLSFRADHGDQNREINGKCLPCTYPLYVTSITNEQ